VQTGQVVALVGGADFNDKETAGEVNFAQRPLPPGSSYKPYDYLALIENSDKVGAGSVLYDTQGPIIDKETGTGYACTDKKRPKDGGNCLWDYDFRFPGPVTLRYALGGSRNVPAVKAMLIAGVNKTIETSEQLGLRNGYKCYTPGTELFKVENESQCYASSAIGDGAYLYLDDHVSAYAALSRNGTYKKKHYVLKIEDQVNKNKVVDEWKDEAGEQVVRPDSAYIVADMMEDPNASYFPAGRKPHRYNGFKFAMKTGTTNDSKDGWMMGFSTYYAAGVWIGSHTGNEVLRGTMEDATQPIWNNWMKRAHEGLTPKEREKPATVQTLDAYVIRSHVGIGSVEPSPAKDLFPSWYKQGKKGTAVKRVIDTVSNKLATDCTPERAKKEVTETGADIFSGDTFQTGSVATDEKDDLHKCEDVRPTISLDVSGSGGSYTFTANFTGGTHAIATVNFLVDGQIIPDGALSVAPGDASRSVSYSSSDGGTKRVTAEIIDAALYDASDSEDVSFSGGDSFTLSASEDNTKIKFSWTDVSGADEYELCWGSCVTIEGSKTSTSINKTTIGNGTYTAKVTARSNGDVLKVSNSAPFTVD
jgi:membrane carboxypeptidase/penicillin-binding protein PbpC